MLISALLSGWMQAKFSGIWFGGLSGVVYALMGSEISIITNSLPLPSRFSTAPPRYHHHIRLNRMCSSAVEKRLGSGKLFVIMLISALLSGWMQAKFSGIWFGRWRSPDQTRQTSQSPARPARSRSIHVPDRCRCRDHTRKIARR
jgi:hypothetical protein